MAKGHKIAWAKELDMAKARKNFDWEKQYQLAFDPEKPKNAVKENQQIEMICAPCV